MHVLGKCCHEQISLRETIKSRTKNGISVRLLIAKDKTLSLVVLTRTLLAFVVISPTGRARLIQTRLIPSST